MSMKAKTTRLHPSRFQWCTEKKDHTNVSFDKELPNQHLHFASLPRRK